jgi:hypothetical protein
MIPTGRSMIPTGRSMIPTVRLMARVAPVALAT